MQCSVNTPPDYCEMRAMLKGGSPLSPSDHHCLRQEADSAGEKGRAVVGVGLSEGGGIGMLCTILSLERQFFLMSDHPALNATNMKLQTQDQCYQQESYAQPLLLWIVFEIQWHPFHGKIFITEIMLIHFYN